MDIEKLKECRKLNFEIRAIEEMLEGLRNNRQRITTNYQALSVQTSEKLDFTNLVDSIIDIERNLSEKIYILCKKKGELFCSIGKLDNSVYRAILINRYLNGYTWEEIRDLMNYSLPYLYGLHGNALKEYENIQVHSKT